MPRINDISDTKTPGLDIPGLPWLRKALGSDIEKGKACLIPGPAGVGKTTLIHQMLGELSQQGVKVLYLTTEQSINDVQRTIRRIFPNPTQALTENFLIDTLDDLTYLPEFLNQKILTPGGEYYGCEVISVDSLQGGGLSGHGGERYIALKTFISHAKAHEITLFLVNQLTKDGGIAGPRKLEHDADITIDMRRAHHLRLLFVPKNRSNRDRFDPLILVMDEHGLRESPHATMRACSALGYCGTGDDFSEAQASVTIPKYGINPGMNAPYLPGGKVKQLLKVLGTLKEIDVADLSYDICCNIPGGNNKYVSVMDLPIVTAILSSHLHQGIDDKALFIGEVDLTRNIRPPERKYLHNLAVALVKSRLGEIKRVYLSDKAADELAEMRLVHKGPVVRDIVDVRGVSDLDGLVKELWPDLVGEEEREEGEEVEKFSPAGCIIPSGAEDLAS